jgi:predicted O-methyltransferase YrrM
MLDVHDLDAIHAATDRIHGWWAPDAGRKLYELVKRSEGNVLELGAWCGRSTAWIAAALAARGDEAFVHSVDTWEGTPDEPVHAELMKDLPEGLTLLGLWQRNLKELDLDGYAVYWKLTTREARRIFQGSTFGVLLIDADHSYKAVKWDFENYSELVPVGGYVVLDDVPSWHGPTKFHREVDRKKWKLVEYWLNQAVFRRIA